MGLYLHDIPLSQARETFRNGLNQYGLNEPLQAELIPIDENAVARILANPVWAKISSPHYNASAMDGFAFFAKKSESAMVTNPVTLRIPEEAVYLDTGDVLPDWANCVVAIENTEALDENGKICGNVRNPYMIRIRASLPPFTNVRPIGEDIIATELVLPVGRFLRPVDLGAAAASGHTHLSVFRQPVVVILPTGSELVEIGKEVEPGEIIEYNSVVLGAQALEWGAKVLRFPITRDDFEQICQKVGEAAEIADLILLNAGSSAGAEDFSSRVVETLGELYVHGIAIRPGHPVILGMIHAKNNRHVPIIGVPGFPVSSAMTGELFVKPLIRLWCGYDSANDETIDAFITKKITSPAGDDDYIRVVAAKISDRYLAAPLSRGAGVITSLVRADGYTVVPRGIQGLDVGEKIRIFLNKPRNEIENTIMVIGSHDLTIDLLAEYLAKRKRRLVSANVGSLGGLISLQRKESHMAGSHLLNPENGTYNFTYIRKYLTSFGVDVDVINWVYREQGLIVQTGNPKRITTLADLGREDVEFVNRQRGAGTRILLDFHLEEIGLSVKNVHGYEHEEFTHLAVGASVSSGRADVGLGIASAAKALGLDFIPLFKERYDFVISTEYSHTDLLLPFYEAMMDKSFRASVQALGGYDVSSMGKQIVE